MVIDLSQIRRSEILICVFFLYVSTVTLFRPVSGVIVARTLAVNCLLVLALCFGTRRWDHGVLAHIRDWFPAATILLAYKEMGWLALPHPNRNFENYWIGLDRVLLDGGLRVVIEGVGPLIPNLLELSYLLTYAVAPLAVAAIYICEKRERIDTMYLILLAGAFAAYGCYPWFPSDTPRHVFEGMDLPQMSALRELNLRILGSQGITTSVFPSGHSAVAFAAAFALMRTLPERKWWGRGVMMLACLIAVATVYGRYHFAIDTVAGFAVAVAAWAWSLTWRKSPSTP